MNVYEIVTDQVTAALERGTVPWQRPWADGEHQSLASGKAYRGVNPLLLDIAAVEHEYASPYWLTYKQAVARGGNVKKGEHATLVVFWNRFLPKDQAALPEDEQRRRMVLRYYRVFNAAGQCEGIDVPETKTRDVVPVDAAESLITRYVDDGGPRLEIRADSGACYSPVTDVVNVPPAERFTDDDAYYSTVLHELTHSTGHKSRLDRDIVTTFGAPSYAREELVAELGSAYLSRVVGLDPTVEQSAAYLKGWIAALKDDPKLIVQASGKAQRAADMIRGITWGNDDDKGTK